MMCECERLKFPGLFQICFRFALRSTFDSERQTLF